MTAFIRLENVVKGWTKGGTIVKPLDDITLEIERGEFFVLLGPSGTGKTTLLNLLAAIDRPNSGKVIVDGVDLGTLSRNRAAAWRKETIGYVFQQANLVPVLTAYENVELPLFLFSLSAKERHRRTTLALEAVGLADRMHHLPRQLSGGQEQRVGIARAIVADPPLLLCDEPTGNLDAESAEGTLTLLDRLNREFKKTIVMVTHDPRAAEHATRTMHLDKGRFRIAVAERRGD